MDTDTKHDRNWYRTCSYICTLHMQTMYEYIYLYCLTIICTMFSSLSIFMQHAFSIWSSLGAAVKFQGFQPNSCLTSQPWSCFSGSPILTFKKKKRPSKKQVNIIHLIIQPIIPLSSWATFHPEFRVLWTWGILISLCLRFIGFFAGDVNQNSHWLTFKHRFV